MRYDAATQLLYIDGSNQWVAAAHLSGAGDGNAVTLLDAASVLSEPLAKWTMVESSVYPSHYHILLAEDPTLGFGDGVADGNGHLTGSSIRLRDATLSTTRWFISCEENQHAIDTSHYLPPALPPYPPTQAFHSLKDVCNTVDAADQCVPPTTTAFLGCINQARTACIDRICRTSSSGKYALTPGRTTEDFPKFTIEQAHVECRLHFGVVPRTEVELALCCGKCTRLPPLRSP